MNDVWYWNNYHTIDCRGQIYFIKGNIRMQIISEKFIYFYLIDEETLMP